MAQVSEKNMPYSLVWSSFVMWYFKNTYKYELSSHEKIWKKLKSVWLSGVLYIEIKKLKDILLHYIVLSRTTD